jgi:hypothetical protein
LDFKKQSFIKEKITSETLLPTNFTSVQNESGKIFMIGGLVKDLVLRQTFMLDENLNYSELSSMKTPRYCPPAVMLMDNYIVVAGG